MKDYAGTVTVNSEPGKCTEFSLYFPCVDAPPAAGTNDDVLLNMPGGSERILFVDDEEDLVTMQIRILTYLGYEVVSATSGAEALEIMPRAWQRL